MQGLADGYFVLPYTLPNYLAGQVGKRPSVDHPEFKKVESEVNARYNKLLSAKGSRSVDSFHRELGLLMWDKCGMARDRAGLKEALELIPKLREEYWKDVRITGSAAEFNQSLEKAGRVADFMEFAELMCQDALHREESCGGHFRSEYQTEEGEAKRNDDEFAYVAAWEYAGETAPAILHKEKLEYERVHLAQRSYK